ncbi:unnamed protein product [Gadus morhua 'NCC']
MGATDLEEAFTRGGSAVENARMTLQRDCIRLGCPPGRLGVEALARTGVARREDEPRRREDEPRRREDEPSDVRTSQATPCLLRGVSVTAEQRAKLAELLQRFTDVFNLGDRNTGRCT